MTPESGQDTSAHDRVHGAARRRSGRLLELLAAESLPM